MFDKRVHVGIAPLFELGFDVLERVNLLLRILIEPINLAVDFLSLLGHVEALVFDGGLDAFDLLTQFRHVLAHFHQRGMTQCGLGIELLEGLFGIIAGKGKFFLQGLVITLLLPICGEQKAD